MSDADGRGPNVGRTLGSVRMPGVAVGACLVACSCASSAAMPATCPPSPYASSATLVIAHAGEGGLAPPNTVAALRAGVDAGADVLDLDLRMTADGVVVARHDRDLATSTDGTGPIDQAAWDEVATLDAAATWTGDPVDGPVAVPRLDDALRAFPDATFSLEIKQTEPSMAQSLCDVLERTGSLDRVFISSNDDVATYAFHDVCPSVVITTTFRDLDDRNQAAASGKAWCSASPINQPPFQAIADRGLAATIDQAHEHGAAVFTWVVDEPDDLRVAAEAGVDAVYTNRPDLARAIVDEVVADR